MDLIQFNCYPEGFGGYTNRVLRNGETWAKDSVVAVLMIGHRNCTSLVFEKGKLISADTIRTGFYDLIRDVQVNTISQSIEDLEYLIPQLNKNSSKSSEILSSLVRANNSKNREAELDLIISAIDDSREKLWNKLVSWLENQIPNRLNELMIFGGGSYYFKDNLESFFSWINIYWGKDVINEIDRISGSNNELNSQLSLRSIDVYGLHKYLIQ